MPMWFRYLLFCVLIAFAFAPGFPAEAQSDSEQDFFLDDPPTAYYFGSSLADITRAALKQRNIALATKLIHMLEETPEYHIFLGELAVSQAEANDWPGSEHTRSLLRDHYSQSYVLSDTAPLLVKQERRLEATGRLLEAWREAVQVRHPRLRLRVLKRVAEEAIRADDTELIPIALDRFETEARGSIQDYALALSDFSRLQAENNHIEEAVRLYERIPKGVWAKDDEHNSELRLDVPSPRPAIAAAYVRAGRPDDAWNFYAAMPTSQEKQETLLAWENAVLPSSSLRDVKPLLEKIFQAADVLPKNRRRNALIALIEKLKYPGLLFSTFGDLRRYHLSAQEEAEFRIALGSDSDSKNKREAFWWLAPLPES